ncbi:TetR/AcrR family transcriptional regulator C-terminal domain-containing protein [Chondromyces crocatus]|uniref:TetR family transcriptional regulator n=1 Tax=Chondromyces crocatus TaxID=52 RepID=A0A0K1EDS1_CHOCO|nr:TetR/AcrR family transcriptional regulator C-terminal domain-containing protein [Chondromyces crocatus]AKT38832.1 TetR family transcriptional regulator [Chondromyces crocatus]
MRIQKDQIVQAALTLLDEEGIEGVTMRKLAQKLNIQAPSLYWHFPNKLSLVEGLADALIEPVGRTVKPRVKWETTLTTLACELRRALLARRDGARVFAGTYMVTENVLRVSEVAMAALRKGGASNRVAAWGTFALFHYVIGFTVEEQALDPRSNPDLGDLSRRRAEFQTFSPASFPTVLDALDDIFDEDHEARFLFGLKSFIAGVKSNL